MFWARILLPNVSMQFGNVFTRKLCFFDAIGNNGKELHHSWIKYWPPGTNWPRLLQKIMSCRTAFEFYFVFRWIWNSLQRSNDIKKRNTTSSCFEDIERYYKKILEMFIIIVVDWRIIFHKWHWFFCWWMSHNVTIWSS